ncbi:hypothetical protein FS749_005239, partial [Ceratobasidium sp. UAMH 11750]
RDCMTGIELESVTFLNKIPRTKQNIQSLSLQGCVPDSGVSKRELFAATNSHGGSPLKKFKSGLIEACTDEELGRLEASLQPSGSMSRLPGIPLPSPSAIEPE